MSDAPNPDPPKPGQWCHIEIPSVDTDRAKAFYSECFGWQFQDFPMPDGSTYCMYMPPDGGMGGGVWNPPEGMPRQTINYINVEEIEASVHAIESNGGSVLVPKQEIPEMGWFSIVADPDGNAFGIWKSMKTG